MTKFAKALRQAARDAALGNNGSPPVAAASSPMVVPPVVPGSSLAAVPAPPDSPVPTSPRPNAERRIADDHLVSLISPAAFEAEQYRALRHIVEEMHKTSGLTIFAVSSPAVGDGKTITAVNLAGALAQSPDAKVLLVDADVRRPTIGTLLGRAGAVPGLIDAILDPTYQLDQVLQLRPQFNLSFIHAGENAPRTPYELLKSARLGELLEEARRRFDYIIVDTPPMGAVQDCRLIARWVDGFLVVVAANRTPRRLVEEALAVIEPAKILGFVFNGDEDRRPTAHYGHTGGYFEPRPAGSDGRNGASRTLAPNWTWRRRERPR
jgi:capsular exopolysaccharide synthesis family protein